MAQLIGALLLIAVAIVAVKVAILLLLLAGLIFRTKETIGLITVLAIFAGFSAHPALGAGLLALAILVSLYFKRKEGRAVKPDD